MKYATKLSESFLKEYKDKAVSWGPLGYIVFKRTYARFISELERTEEWNETCARVCNSIVQYGGLFIEKELEQLYDLMFNLKGLPAGRILWQAGSKTVEKVGADSLCNCWQVAIKNLDSFTFLFNQLLLGGGVGFNILPANVYELPMIKYNPEIKRIESFDCDYIIPDNREGWVDFLKKILEAFCYSGKRLYYSTQCIRPSGQPMLNFGGHASGAENLVSGITKIIKILRSRVGQKLRPIDTLDVINILGVIGINSGAKRTSEMAIGDFNDPLFLDAKNRQKNPIANWRVMSNNSLSCDTVEHLPSAYWDQFESEPYGLVNLQNCRRYGRLIDGENYRPDDRVVGLNPCGEATLENKEPCDLADIFLPNIKTTDEFHLTARLLYKVCKTITTMHFSDPETNEVVHRNHRIGLGLTGWMAAPQWRNPEILNKVYRDLEYFDLEYCNQLNCTTSKKFTVVKPSGTLSLLPFGISPGMHPALARWLIRRIRFSADDPLVETCLKAGYSVEPRLELDGSEDTNTVVISFPIDMGPNVITEDQLSVRDELEQQKVLQTYWADQAVSCTHYFKENELPDIKKWLEQEYDTSMKACSFLPVAKYQFIQAPLEKISEEEYCKLKSKCQLITNIIEPDEQVLQESLECSAGGCSIR